jgi:hypothetical protein
MEKRIIGLAVSVIIFVFSPAHAFTLTPEFNTDRPGCDFRNFAVPGANFGSAFSVCMDACGLDSSCQAWNFDSRSGAPRCFLKNCVPPATVARGTVGGIKFQATMSVREDQIDRPGCDFRTLPVGDSQICVNSCAIDPRCQAWNFDSRSGAARCFLKNCVPTPTATNSFGVTSGVKFSQ